MADSVRTLYGVLMLLSGVASTAGNLLLLLLLLLHKELRTDTLGLAVSCGLSDLVLGLTAIPLGVHYSLAGPPGPPGDGPLCQGGAFLFLLLQTSSLHLLAWSTLDRFTEVCFALSYGALWTAWRCRAVLVLVWGFCLLGAAGPLLGFGRYAYSESRFLCCLSYGPENRVSVMTWMAAGVAAPLLAVCGLNAYLVHVARKQARRGTFRCNELHCYYVPADAYLRSSRVLLTSSGCLLVCWIPYVSVCLYEMFRGRPPAVASALSAWLVLSSAAVNPWITCTTRISFRAALRRSFRRFIQVCSGRSEELRPQNLHLDTLNCISTTATAVTRSPPGPPPPL